jgi:hypothetical protein
VHHLTEHHGDKTRFFHVSLADLQSLCRDHHERLHGRKLEPEWIGVDGWPVEQVGNANLKPSEHWEDDDDGDGRERD